MIDHPARARVAEIMVARRGRAGEEPTRGSGYLVSPGWVLTAHHVVKDAVSVGVWLGAPPELAPEAGIVVEVGQVLTLPAADLALLPVDGQADGPPCEPALFGRLDRDPGPPVPAAAAGCPRFKLRPAPDRPGVLLRELDYAIGSIAGLSDAKTGRFAFAVDVPPGPDPEPDKHSPWEGMSGAAVWASNRLIGVVGQHHPREGLATLTVCPVERLFGSASADQLGAWRAALPQLPGTAEDLWLATPPTLRKIEVARARRAVEELAPRVLIGRGAELAALEAFTGSGVQWRWIQGDAFAGKTALLAWFALYPPERVDVVACFLRRASGENTPDYALDVLIRQLVVLADQRGYLPSPSVSGRVSDLVDLLEEAARACAERGRQLLMLVDGLDECDATAGLDLATWLPDASKLPSTALLLVASRAGADAHLPPAHPLCDRVQRITASEAATEIRRAAHAELEQALQAPGDFLFPLTCCLAVAGSGLTASELRDLLKRRGRDNDISEIEALLGSSLNRSLTRLHDPDNEGEQVYVFAHETLLAEARIRFAADLAAYEDLIDAWASEYAQRSWPVHSPRYLLRSYTRELARRAHDPGGLPERRRAAVDQLFSIVTHPARQEWLRERLGNDLAAMSELEQAEHLNRTADRPDLGRATRLAKSRDALRDRSSFLSAAALTVLAGHDWRKAAVLAHGAGDGSVAAVAGELVRTAKDELGPASTVTRLIEAPSYAAPALSELALAHHDRGQLAPAEETAAAALDAAGKVGDFSARVTCLTQVAAALTTVGLQSAAGEALARATEAARRIVDDHSRVTCLMRIAASLASAKGPGSAQSVVDKALAIARGVDDPARAAALLTAIASSDGAGLVSQDDRADALRKVRRAAESISSVQDRPRALAAIALAQVHFAVPYESSLKEAIELAAQVEYLKFHAEILEACATVLGSAGQGEQAASLLEEAVAVADGPTGRWDEYTWWRRADTLKSLARTQARQGLHQAARDTVTTHLAHEQQQTLVAIAGIQINAGELGEAAATIQLISGPDRYIPASGQLACALARKRDPNASSMLDEFVAMLTGPDAGQNVAGGLGYAALAAHYLGQEKRALELAEMSIGTQRPRDPLERVEVFMGIGRAYAAADNRERAIQHLVQAMRIAEDLDAGDEPHRRSRYDEAIIAVAVAQAAIGQYSQALAAIAQLKTSPWPAWREKAKAYIAVASLQVQSGQTADADSTFSLAVATAVQEYEPLEAHRSNNMLESIALEQAHAGLQSAAWATVEELREKELEYWHTDHADRCLAKIAEYYASGSLHDDARKTAERIRGASIRAEIEQSFSDGTKTGAADAASPAGQADKPDGWESQARQMLDQLESNKFAYDSGSPAGQTFLDLAEKAKVHGSHRLAIRLVAAAFALLPCHKVLEAACSVEPSLGTLLEELEPW
jgi:tetratricopeptide (TPR) repeat protein